ncbi:MAG: hypothetical protein Ct9H300mP25_02350 [Acidobacteriota bacterium]|nr:MAG: hypothetical protein Ct9H300mP25_02350 [Acidobacteriota bacterium]
MGMLWLAGVSSRVLVITGVLSEGEGGIGVPELSVGVPFPSVAMEILR